MSAPALTVAFGDLDTCAWGVVWGSFAAVGDQVLGPLTIEVGAEKDWLISADGTQLAVTPEGPPSSDEGLGQLCRVRGQVGEIAVDCLGQRQSQSEPFDASRYDSVRAVSAWFEPDEGLTALALRPRKAGNHAKDLVTATLLDPAGPVVVEDPRLSTTYAADGRPTRMSLELWLGDEQEHYPRRAAGESVGLGLSSTLPGLEIQAELLACHSRGREGTGVYLLARVR